MARRARSFVGGSKRHGEWAGSSPITSFQALAAGTAVLSQIFSPFVGGETVIRTRGLFSHASDQNAAVEDRVGAVGIGVVSAQAVSVGITAVPHPDTDSGWNGWLYHSYFAGRMGFASASGFNPGMAVDIVIDSKAMRKVGDEERVVVVVQNSASTGMVFYDAIRIYSKPF